MKLDRTALKITAVDVVVFVPVFVGAFYLGINLPLSISCGFLAVSIANVIWASINIEAAVRNLRRR